MKIDPMYKLFGLTAPNFLIDVASLLSGRIINLILGIISGILVARLLGPEKKGILTTILVIPTLILSLSDLGFRQATIYYLGKKIHDDQSVISTLVMVAWIATILTVVISCVAYYIGGYNTRYGWDLVLISLALIPFRLLITYFTGVLLAKSEIHKVTITYLISDIIYFLGIAFLYISQNSNIKLILLAQIVSLIVSSAYVTWSINGYAILKPSYRPNIILTMFRKGLVYAIALFILGLNYNLDIVILGRTTNATQVGIYSVGVSVANMLWLLPTALTMVIFSRSATSQDATGYAKKMARLLRISLWVAIIPLTILYIITPIIIPLLYSSQFAGSAEVVQAILPGVWAMLIFMILNGDLAGRGRPDAALWVFLLALVVNILLNLLWDPTYGARGSAWASSVSYIIGAFLYAKVYATMSGMHLRELFLIERSDIEFVFNNIRNLHSKPSTNSFS